MAAISEYGKTLGKAQVFWTLWLAGLAGIFSLLLVPITLPVEGGLPLSLGFIKELSLIQPIILLTVMTWVGTTLASRVGLEVPLIREIYESGRVGRVLRSQLIPASIATLMVFILMLGIQTWAEPHLPTAYLAVNENAETLLPPLTRFFYGGVTEEILMRWGFMTLLVWLPWKLLQKSVGHPQVIYVWGAILVTALLFGIGHLPLLFNLVPQASNFLVAYIIGLNAMMGIIAGWLFWQHGLEAAILAHVLFHILGLLVQ